MMVKSYLLPLTTKTIIATNQIVYGFLLLRGFRMSSIADFSILKTFLSYAFVIPHW